MHRRFRRDLHSMRSWYRTSDIRRKPEASNEENQNGGEKSNKDNENDEDTIVVLVTHGARCNALIGALTNQPVLLDVGIASPTMPVRKNHPPMVHESSSLTSSSDNISTTAPSASRRRSLIEPDISHDYKIKLTASADHLPSSQSFSSISLTQRSVTSSGPNTTTRYRPGSLIGLSRSTYGIPFPQNDQAYSSIPPLTSLWTKLVTHSSEISGSNGQYPRSSSENKFICPSRVKNSSSKTTGRRERKVTACLRRQRQQQ